MNRPIIYYGIPKSGSTSLRVMLKHNFPSIKSDDPNAAEWRQSNEIINGRTKHIKIITQQYRFIDSDTDLSICLKSDEKSLSPTISSKGKEHSRKVIVIRDMDQFYKFASIRNPFCRMLSLFRHRHFNTQRNFSRKISTRFPYTAEGFENYLREISVNQLEGLNALTAYEWISARDTVYCDDFIRFENYESDVKKVFKNLGIEKFDMIHHYKSKTPDYKTMYTSESRQLVTDMFEKDLNLFNYKF